LLLAALLRLVWGAMLVVREVVLLGLAEALDLQAGVALDHRVDQVALGHPVVEALDRLEAVGLEAGLGHQVDLGGQKDAVLVGVSLRLLPVQTRHPLF
jgi:hypothetical protein